MNILFYVFIPTHIEEYPEDIEYLEDIEYYMDEEYNQDLLINNHEKWNIV